MHAPSAEGLKIMPLEIFPYFQAYKKYRPLISNSGCLCDGFTFEVNTEYQSSLHETLSRGYIRINLLQHLYTLQSDVGTKNNYMRFFFILSLSKQVFRFSLSMLMFSVHS